MNLYLECHMGAAGDMLAGALLDLFEEKAQTLGELQAVMPPHTELLCEERTTCGVRATHLRVLIHGEEEAQGAHHAHHHGRMLDEVTAIIDGTAAPQEVKENAKAIYRLIAEAESTVHGETVGEVHFHELGMLDAIADVTICAYLIHKLRPSTICASRINAGGGTVHCAHGVLPVPAPATALLLEGMPFYKSDAMFGELCTPTGAAVLKYYVSEFTDAPQFGRSTRIGVGCGTKEFEAAPNTVRAYLDTTATEQHITELACNVDDMTGEEIAFAAEVMLRKGALDAFVRPVMMKKGRPAYQLTVLCPDDKKDDFAALIFRHTNTIGIRCYRPSRYTLKREIREEAGVHIKRSEGYDTVREKTEFEDLKAYALQHDISLFEARERLK